MATGFETCNAKCSTFNERYSQLIVSLRQGRHRKSETKKCQGNDRVENPPHPGFALLAVFNLALDRLSEALEVLGQLANDSRLFQTRDFQLFHPFQERVP